MQSPQGKRLKYQGDSASEEDNSDLDEEEVEEQEEQLQTIKISQIQHIRVESSDYNCNQGYPCCSHEVCLTLFHPTLTLAQKKDLERNGGRPIQGKPTSKFIIKSMQSLAIVQLCLMCGLVEPGGPNPEHFDCFFPVVMAAKLPETIEVNPKLAIVNDYKDEFNNWTRHRLVSNSNVIRAKKRIVDVALSNLLLMRGGNGDYGRMTAANKEFIRTNKSVRRFYSKLEELISTAKKVESKDAQNPERVKATFELMTKMLEGFRPCEMEDTQTIDPLTFHSRII